MKCNVKETYYALHCCSVVDSGAGSGMCKPTNQSRLCTEEAVLKETEEFFFLKH